MGVLRIRIIKLLLNLTALLEDLLLQPVRQMHARILSGRVVVVRRAAGGARRVVSGIAVAGAHRREPWTAEVEAAVLAVVIVSVIEVFLPLRALAARVPSEARVEA